MNSMVRKLYKLIDNRVSDDTVVLSIGEVNEIIQEIERLEDEVGSLEATIGEWLQFSPVDEQNEEVFLAL